MKKYSPLLLVLILISGLTNAQQQLANSGFEKWDTIADYTQPKNWYTLNPLTAFGFEPTSTLTINAHSGLYAVELETKANSSQDIPGLLATGPIIGTNGNPDFNHLAIKFNSKPEYVKFYFKAYPKLDDTCIFIMVLTKWNPVKLKNDTLGEALFVMPDSISNFTLAIVPFTYYSTLLPDSAIILASSSINGFRPNVGSKFIIDDITMVYTPAGLSVNEKNNNATIYPNPVNQFIHIDFELGSTNWVTLLDDAGRVLYTQLLLNQRNQVDFTLFEEGVYTLLIRGENNETAYRRLIIQH